MDLIFNGLGLWQNFGDQKKVMESKKKKKRVPIKVYQYQPRLKLEQLYPLKNKCIMKRNKVSSFYLRITIAPVKEIDISH